MKNQELVGKIVSFVTDLACLHDPAHVDLTRRGEFLVLAADNRLLLGVVVQRMEADFSSLCLRLLQPRGDFAVLPADVVGVADGKGLLLHLEQRITKMLSGSFCQLSHFQQDRLTAQYAPILNLVQSILNDQILADEEEEEEDEDDDDEDTVLAPEQEDGCLSGTCDCCTAGEGDVVEERLDADSIVTVNVSIENVHVTLNVNPGGSS